MIAFVAGTVIAVCLQSITGMRWGLVGWLWALAAAIQMVYAQRLNRLLRGADPSATYRAKNLKELRLRVNVPLVIIGLSFLARTLAWAGAFAVIFAMGWLEIAKVKRPH